MKGLLNGPPDLYERIHQRAELMNAPRVGLEENFAFASQQLNIASVSPESSGKSPLKNRIEAAS